MVCNEERKAAFLEEFRRVSPNLSLPVARMLEALADGEPHSVRELCERYGGQVSSYRWAASRLRKVLRPHGYEVAILFLNRAHHYILLRDLFDRPIPSRQALLWQR